MQSRTCSSYAEVKPTIDKVNYKFKCNYNMKQNTKDWIQHSSALMMLVSGIVLAMLSFFLNNYDIKENVLWYIAQTLIYAGSIFGVSIFITGKFGELHSFIDKIRKDMKKDEL
jgi:cytochrome b subunit of formate dehydrogenase